MVVVGTNSRSSSNRFGSISTFNEIKPVRLPPGRFRLATNPTATGSNPIVKTIGIVVVAAFAGSAAGLLATITATRPTNQIGRQRRQPIVLVVRPAIFDRHVTALDIAGLAQALAERRQECAFVQAMRCGETRSPASPAAARAPRAATPRRAAEQRDERTSPHSITSSARASSVAGTSRPSALAVLS